jgi:hypothetical protein
MFEFNHAWDLPTPCAYRNQRNSEVLSSLQLVPESRWLHNKSTARPPSPHTHAPHPVAARSPPLTRLSESSEFELEFELACRLRGAGRDSDALPPCDESALWAPRPAPPARPWVGPLIRVHGPARSSESMGGPSPLASGPASRRLPGPGRIRRERVTGRPPTEPARMRPRAAGPLCRGSAGSSSKSRDFEEPWAFAGRRVRNRAAGPRGLP